MRLLFFLSLAVMIGGFLYKNPDVLGRVIPTQLFTQEQKVTQQTVPVNMYALTTCGVCKLIAQEMKQSGIKFSEYYVDIDPAHKSELDQYVARAGMHGGVGMPVLVIGNQIFSGNTPISTIIAAVQAQPSHSSNTRKPS